MEDGNIPTSIVGAYHNVQIVSTSTEFGEEQPVMYTAASHEPSVAQTLLNMNIANIDEGMEPMVIAGNIDGSQAPTQMDSAVSYTSFSAHDGANMVQDDGSSIIRLEDASEEQKRLATDSIRAQISTLCGQLSDLGEECFLLSLRMMDGACQHVGSVKGDHFCLLRPELATDFSNFCQGLEEDNSGVEKETDSVMDDVTQENEEDVHTQQQQQPCYIQDQPKPVTVVTKSPTPAKPVIITPVKSKPKVIVLKKNADGKLSAKDPQYVVDKQSVTAASQKTDSVNVATQKSVVTVTTDKQKGDNTENTMPIPAIIKAGDESEPISETGDHSEKENEQTGPSILFLCDVCKSVFNNVHELRHHKKEVHNETDWPCGQCGRIFTQQRALDRHKTDAHFDDARHICDSCVMEFNSAQQLHDHVTGAHNPDLPMRCDVCEKTFPDLAGLMAHRKAHFDYACFCKKCWQGFFDYLELDVHQQHNCQYKEALYKCFICGKKFSKASVISKHIDTHPVHSPHVCRMCGRGFDTEKDLRNHRMAAHIIRPYKCEMCEKTFKKKDGLIDHRRIHLRVKYPGSVSLMEMATRKENGTNNNEIEPMEVNNDEPRDGFECLSCGVTLASQHMLDQHMHEHFMATEEFKCEHCDKVFFSHSLMSQHCRKDHKVYLNTKEKLHACELKMCDWEGCNKTFYDKHKLRQHMKYHEQRADKIARGIPLTPARTLTTCEICGKVLKYKSYLKAHMLSHTNHLPYQCEQCGQSYPNSKRLADHIRVHNGEKPFKCKLCDKGFTSSNLRNQHMVIHWGHKKFICDVCGKGFMSRKHFNDHLRIHQGEQQYRCEVCGKEFIYYRSLVRHSQVHIDPKVRHKPYKCEFCQKEYTEVTGYKHHMRSVHTGENPYQCDLCGEGFHRNDKLKRHMKTRHNMNHVKQSLLVTTRRQSQGGPVLVKAEAEPRDDILSQPDRLLQIVQAGENLGDMAGEVHVDVVQDGSGGAQQVFLIGLNNQDGGGETTYLQETQVIEGPDGVRYIIAGNGEELQVIESGNIQHLEGDVIEGDIVQQVTDTGEENVLIMNDGAIMSSDQETLSTLANMASVAEIAQQE